MHRSKAVWAAAVAIALASCMPQVESREPLFEQGNASLRPGLWALVGYDCSRPTDARIFDWPDCAVPVRIAGNELTILVPSPRRAAFLLADGNPIIVQSRLSEDDVTSPMESTGFGYYSFVPDSGAPPFTSGEVRTLRCPRDDEIPIEGMALENQGEVEGASDGNSSLGSAARWCEAVTAEAVREASRRALVKLPDWQAVWIAELP
jgi:hypothetical protein